MADAGYCSQETWNIWISLVRPIHILPEEGSQAARGGCRGFPRTHSQRFEPEGAQGAKAQDQGWESFVPTSRTNRRSALWPDKGLSKAGNISSAGLEKVVGEFDLWCLPQAL